MSNKNWLLAALTVLVATATSFFSHVALQQWSAAWFARNSDYMRSLHILTPPYSSHIVLVAGLLQLLPISAEFALCAFAWAAMPFKARSTKASLLVVLFLLAHDVIRTDIMTIMVGNPLGVAFISRADSIIPKLLTALIFAAALMVWDPSSEIVLSQPGAQPKT